MKKQKENRLLVFFIGMFLIYSVAMFATAWYWATKDAPGFPPVAVSQEGEFDTLLDYIWLKESTMGQNKDCRVQKPTGELGEYQIRPIFVADVLQRDKYLIDRMDNESCRKGISLWLKHYSVKFPAWDFWGIDRQYQLYRYGYSGFKKAFK